MFSLLRHWLLTADPTTHVRLSNTSDWLDLMNQINSMSPSTYSKEQGISWYSKWLCESQEDLKRVTSYSKYSLNYIIYLKNSQPIEFANLTYTLMGIGPAQAFLSELWGFKVDRGVIMTPSQIRLNEPSLDAITLQPSRCWAHLNHDQVSCTCPQFVFTCVTPIYLLTNLWMAIRSKVMLFS